MGNNFTTWQPIAIHTWSTISRSKGNQIMKLGLLIEYNIRKIAIEKSFTKCGEKLLRDPF